MREIVYCPVSSNRTITAAIGARTAPAKAAAGPALPQTPAHLLPDRNQDTSGHAVT
ncbi:hypothetical protein PV458_22835 [Streptomyces sp. MN03-5084-2B]|nr:hypothetical protein [Streptomyces sp. MN03-5084-2B]